ncbi:MAG: ABC transporter ATP-binding protein [Rhodobacteraceae bacterium]|nr:ABC transporter ATP-binding protein [Paracoccaceae bacterium]
MSRDAAKARGEVFAPWLDENAEPLIRFDRVTKKFGDFVAIDDLSIDIYEREFFALLGPSGCGKTTLMRMLAGFETPTTGKIMLAGKNIGPIPANKRPVNMMFQSYALFPHLTVADNIAFGLKRSDMPKDQIAARVDEMLGLVQLKKFGGRKPHQISGGQRQRVALARALAKSPKLLLLDEPLAALDRKLREETQFELMDIQEKLGTTFVIVTHDQEEAMTVASRVAVMDHGQLIQVATPEAIYETPNSRYVADFIGDINLIEGAVKSVARDIAEISWAESMEPLRATAPEGLTKGANCCFAIRPEKVSISAERPEKAANALPGKVIDIGYLGNMSTYHVELANGQMVKAQVPNQNRLSRHAFTWEDAVWVSFTATAGLVLTA